MRIFLLLPTIFLVVICKGHRNFSTRNNYLQYLRSQTFMQEKPKYQKLNQNYSEDLNEFDEYEDEELDTEKQEDINKAIMRDGTSPAYTTKESRISNSSNKNKLEFKNIEQELQNTGEVLNEEKDNLLLMGGGRECSVSAKGTLDVSINSSDIFNLIKYNVEISSSSILIRDINNSNVVKEIPFKNIKLPIETIEETRECWNIKFHKEKILFCEKKKEDRDRWITNILKALFCNNTNNLTIEDGVHKDFSTKVDIPKESTVDARIAASSKNGSSDSSDNSSNSRVKPKESNNITISNLKNEKPEILIN
ncbi:hypothetical protein, conserved [Plasmodium gonderi]|uniref:Crystalloid-specific PH domain-containing protein n=1 Tax=Plasmodium gonderi TaxID=77519 RepID=A0A1Y1JD85_PLAGO|nr:hypothetical protein, conserved [Plasmodium gonderi]GAW79648.1 hypothetical protein, conserved [Plasmodium gonderi]